MTEEEIRERMKPELEKFEWEKRYRPENFLEKAGKAEEEEREISEAVEKLLVDMKDNLLLKTAERYGKLDFDTKRRGEDQKGATRERAYPRGQDQNRDEREES
ncbi:hypothetical protein AKJ57_03210 [candidate division MSBL1 archaeon SCGC-AAA259A05]|uniref:Uncharacterized protein n=1 Tax=candidate division MSBL1 archaeon SCGC-AAA259A05 TaxID=1698259 RepID=A0A133U9M5_9EURY|nr:hypothetical protein AKJ57_03210 [candidate division MSBL1 archaeon SCGC-AAA259A05]